MKSTVSIHAKYTFPSSDQEDPVVIEQKFDDGNCQIARLGLPEGVEAVKVRALLYYTSVSFFSHSKEIIDFDKKLLC